MAVVEIGRPLQERDGTLQFDSFAPAISVADFWAEAGAAEARWRHLRAIWSGPPGTLLTAALTVLIIDSAVLLRLVH